jgi:hypothetical protein
VFVWIGAAGWETACAWMDGDCAGPAQLLNTHVAANKLLAMAPNAHTTRFNISTSSHLAKSRHPKYTVPMKKVPHSSFVVRPWSFQRCGDAHHFIQG